MALTQKTKTLKCPNCSANLPPVDPQLREVRCGYCDTAFEVVPDKAPATATNGTRVYLGDARVSTSLTAQGKLLVAGFVALMLVGPVVGIVASVSKARAVQAQVAQAMADAQHDVDAQRNPVHAYPLSCARPGTVDLSGDFVSDGPVIVSLVRGCKVRLKSGTLKASTLYSGPEPVDITLDGVTLETKGALLTTEGDATLLFKSSSATAAGAGISGNNVTLTMRGKSTLTASGGAGVAAGAKLTLEATGGAIEASGDALKVHDESTITLDGTAVRSREGTAVALQRESTLKLTDAVIEGPKGALISQRELNVEARGDTRIASTGGDGIYIGARGTLNLGAPTVEGKRGIVGRGPVKLDLTGGSITGQKGALLTEHGSDITADGARFVGNAGPGIALDGGNCSLKLSGGAVSGALAFDFERRPTTMEISGTTIEGEQRIR